MQWRQWQWWQWLLAAALGWGAYNSFVTRQVRHAPGVVAAKPPLQTTVKQPAFRHANYTVEPLASFSIRARVLGRKNYTLGREADLSPMDFALGWGPMSDSAVLQHLDISQSNRFYFWRSDNVPPISIQDITTHSSNVHIIPANDAVLKQLERVRVGAVVSLKGKLVQVTGDGGFTWRSSLTREDTGNGACEVMWVESVSVEL
jgi:hypothetical protein